MSPEVEKGQPHQTGCKNSDCQSSKVEERIAGEVGPREGLAVLLGLVPLTDHLEDELSALGQDEEEAGH
jgi:hypothetical protein